LLTAVTNIAVDNLALTTAKHIDHGIARVVSQRYEEELHGNDATPKDLQAMLYPEMVRLHLDSLGYARGTNRYNSHVKNHADEVLKTKNVRTFAATCSIIVSMPVIMVKREPISLLVQPGSLILIDEAAQATEPDVLQVFNCADPQTSIHQIGDHRQLPATVTHPANRADNNDISMFERLLSSGIFPCVILQEQWRMQASIAAYSSMQFYSDGLITKTPRRTTMPEGFYWPGPDPVAFVNVHSVRGEQRGNNGKGKLFNTAETMKVANLVQDFQTWGAIGARVPWESLLHIQTRCLLLKPSCIRESFVLPM
jgi:hypothetical protein